MNLRLDITPIYMRRFLCWLCLFFARRGVSRFVVLFARLRFPFFAFENVCRRSILKIVCGYWLVVAVNGSARMNLYTHFARHTQSFGIFFRRRIFVHTDDLGWGNGISIACTPTCFTPFRARAISMRRLCVCKCATTTVRWRPQRRRTCNIDRSHSVARHRPT